MPGIKTKDNPKTKTYCYKSDCKVVETGFHLEKYQVCTVCKEEVSESLKNSVKERNRKDEPDTPEEDWGDGSHFPFLLP